ncbi:MAG: hypothetical protein ACREGF_07370 [Candidatus Saccharimonadales bacterium]
MNLKRIRQRVRQGGHNVPAADVRRRYKRSLYNLFQVYFDLCDIILVYDNTSGEPHCVAVKSTTGTLVLRENLDLWSRIKKQAGETE